jgi:hypothetical protein
MSEKDLIKALANFSQAIEMLSDALTLKEKNEREKGPVSEKIKQGSLTDSLIKIDQSVKSIKEDTKVIIDQQKILLSRQDKSPKEGKGLSDIFGSGANKTNTKTKIKDGASMLVSISAGILAIGLAFKIIGGVNFASVIALSIAIPLLVKSFDIFSKSKNLNKSSALNYSIILVAISAAILGSSYLLSKVKPIGLGQAITSILIAGVFAVISFGIGKIIKGLNGINPSNALKISLFMPVLLIAISAAILGSSYLLSKVKPIGLGQALSSILISFVFIPLSIATIFISKSIKDIDPIKVVLIPIVLVAMSYAIQLSSGPLSKTTVIPIGKLINIALISISIAVVSLVLGATFKFLGKIDIKTMLTGAINMILIAGSVAVSSRLLALGDYSKYPPVEWIIPTTISMVVFGLGAVALGTVISSGVGAVAIAAGLVAILGIATSVVATSQILKLGDYSKYPPLEWAKSISLSLLAFGTGALVLGTVILSGVGAVAIAAGLVAILGISKSIVESSIILQGGKYTGGPTKTWSEGISLALAAFAPVYSKLSGGLLGAILGDSGDPAVAIRSISNGIKESSIILQGGNYKGGPTKEWSEGISLALVAFSETYSKFSKGGILSIFTGNSSNDVMNSIISTSIGISKSSIIISKGKYNTVISREYLNNLLAGIDTYIKLSNKISESDIDYDGIKDFSDGMVRLANAYEKLSKSLGSLNSQLSQVDIERMTMLKNLSGSIVMLSLMDSDQFESMMDALESKAKIFVDVIKDTNESVNSEPKAPISANKTIKTQTPAIKTKLAVSNNENDTMEKLLSGISSLNASVSSINNIVNGTIKEYMDKKKISDKKGI